VLDPALERFIVELTASEAEIDRFIGELAGLAEILEVVRSGTLGIARHGPTLELVT
jgi:acetolactate synthase small subunit